MSQLYHCASHKHEYQLHLLAIMGETQIQAKLDLHPRKQLAQVFSFLKQFIIQTNYNLCKEKKTIPRTARGSTVPTTQQIT